MSRYVINNVELEINMEDYEFQRKYEDAFEEMAEEEKRLQKMEKASEITRAYCQMFRNLFDAIFGEGTSKELFGDKYDIASTDKVYEKFISICSEQAKAANARRNRLANKYRPNKEQRRAN